MDSHLKYYFRQSSEEEPHGNFHTVLSLHESPEFEWETLHQKIPSLPRGWYELSRLSSKDRIEFSRDFWLSQLPYRAELNSFLEKFFVSLDDVGILATQKKFDDPFEASLIYCLREEDGFFRGTPPIDPKGLEQLQALFAPYLPPNDYLAFLHIHDGFSKATDCTGIAPSKQMREKYEMFQQMLEQQDPIITSIGTTVDPKTLIPFYESFGMPFFQCFWAEWYPEQEMGNVYYSTKSKTISDLFTRGASSESMAFPTFVDWLTFYLERIV